MSLPYIGEIRLFGGNFAPVGWAFCDGSLLPISEYDALFALIGTTYGGDGQTTFAVPDLRGRVPIHMGGGPGLTTRIIGEMAGAESVTLNTQQIPAHTHALGAAQSGHLASPANAMPAAPRDYPGFRLPGGITPMAAGAIAPAGGSQPHSNLAPYLCVSFIISLFGVFPSPT
jgi:microcystin-dependent protein